MHPFSFRVLCGSVSTYIILPIQGDIQAEDRQHSLSATQATRRPCRRFVYWKYQPLNLKTVQVNNQPSVKYHRTSSKLSLLVCIGEPLKANNCQNFGKNRNKLIPCAYQALFSCE